MELSELEKAKLKQINENQAAAGAFSGMIFNASMAHPDADIDYLIQKALKVRVRVEGLSKW